MGLLDRVLSRAWPLVLAGALTGCLDGRFPTCKDNQECAKQTDGGASVCYDLRCVECKYDGDCPVGKACTPTNVCESLGGTQSASNENERRDAGTDKWDPGSWDDCAKDCKDPECVKSCDARFPKSDRAKKPPKKPAPK